MFNIAINENCNKSFQNILYCCSLTRMTKMLGNVLWADDQFDEFSYFSKSNTRFTACIYLRWKEFCVSYFKSRLNKIQICP